MYISYSEWSYNKEDLMEESQIEKYSHARDKEF